MCFMPCNVKYYNMAISLEKVCRGRVEVDAILQGEYEMKGNLGTISCEFEIQKSIYTRDGLLIWYLEESISLCSRNGE